MISTRAFVRRAALLAVAVSPLLTTQSSAQTLQWTGGAAGTNTNFETAASWSPSRGTPSATDDLVIATRNGAGSLPATLSTGTSNFSLRSLSFDNADGRFASGALTVRNAAAIVNLTFSTADVNILSAINNSTVTLNRNSSTNQLTFLLGYSGLANVHVDGTSSLTINNATVSGAGGLRKNGVGTLTLGAENTFTGGLHVLAGTISFAAGNRLGSSEALNAAAVVLNGGTLQMTGATVSNSASNRGMQIGNSGGTIDVTNVAGTFGFNGTIQDVSGESGRLTKTGAGTLALNTENTFSGGLHVLEGVVSFTLHNRLGSSATPNAAAVVLNGGTLQMTGTSSNSGNNRGMKIGNNGGTIEVTDPVGSFSFNATIQDIAGESGRLVKTGPGELTLYSTNTYSGGFELQAGTLSINASGGNTSSAVLNSPFGIGTLRLTGGTLISTTDTGRTVRNNTELGGAVTVTDAEAGSQGGFSWSRGASGTTTLIADSTLNIATTVNWSQNISGGFSLTKTGTGTLTLDGTNTYTGGTIVNGGTLVASTGAIPGDITNNAVVNFDQSSNGTYSGNITGTGSLTKTGTGVLTLTNYGLNYSGGTTVSAGGLRVEGTLNGPVTVAAGAALSGSGYFGGAVSIAGTHSPGSSPGIQSFGDNLTYQADATVNWELSANTATQGDPTAVYDQINVAGTLDFSGATSLALSFNGAGSGVNWNDAFWDANRSWKIYDTASVSNFGNLSLVTSDWADGSGNLFDTVLAGAGFSLAQVGNDIFLNYAAAPIPEPATAAALLGAAILALALQRRHRAPRP